ncbi:MAG: outer membrane lipoprotein carrier protein LolA [Desulfobacterales bacterium]|nr:outer membrane lipoprotein carrier protein LolA [Deltaproteobacteria bacterium]NNK84015.1 outer membrane lipoprotein carrier protein LolA [Desulfobacterales bacterium]NNL42459.1 outer membrane lipoprotein carrier protein LolA [Desulfobacterales bacterium]
MKLKNSYNAPSIFFLIAASCLTIGWADSWDQIKNTAGQVQTVKCDFIQEKHIKILANPLVSEGALYFKVPGSLRWEYISPIRSILLMHQGKTKRFVKRNDAFIEDSSANLQAMGIVVKEITMWLSGRFDENPQFKALLKSGRKILLLPKEKSFSMMIQKIELILSDRPGIIKSVTIYESDESFTRLVFNNARLNDKIEDTLFRKIY